MYVTNFYLVENFARVVVFFRSSDFYGVSVEIYIGSVYFLVLVYEANIMFRKGLCGQDDK